jgi:hypothetical protein
LDSSPTDFIVTEISLSGQLVEFSSNYEYEPSKKLSINSNSKYDAKRQKERIVFEEPSEGWSNVLRNLIGKHGQKQLHDLFDETYQEHICYFVAPNAFTDRIFLQECIQVCFSKAKFLWVVLLNATSRNVILVQIAVSNVPQRMKREKSRSPSIHCT